MTFSERLSHDLKDAMRARDEVRLRTLRSLRSALQSAEIAQRQDGEATLSDEDAQAVLVKQAKQRRESITQFEQAGRDDLAAREQEELDVIEAYLPRQLTDDEIAGAVRAVVAEIGASGPADMGKVMGPVMGRLRGQADGRRVQQIVRDVLSA